MRSSVATQISVDCILCKPESISVAYIDVRGQTIYLAIVECVTYLAVYLHLVSKSIVTYNSRRTYFYDFDAGTVNVCLILDNVEEQRQREREAEEARLKAQREAEVADSIKAATIEDAASTTTPKKATIVTKKGVRMKVWICSDTATMVSYKKVNSAKAAIFNMSKSKIKNIIY